MLQLPPTMTAALPLLHRLHDHQFEAVFVGGAVRDTVLGLPLQDIDIATSASPEQVMAIFPKCIPTGLTHGTVTVVHDGIGYEVTTYRIESAYTDRRKPDQVAFVDNLDEDLIRRDFTMNAMAIRQDGALYDPYGGLEDLRRHRLRPVGSGEERFQEDALRMLRAIRFLAVYRLHPTASLWRALIRHRELMRHIAMERVQAELDKMIGSDAPARAIGWLGASGLLHYTKEELPRTPQDHEAVRSSRLDLLDSIDERWASIFIVLSYTAEKVKSALKSLRFGNRRIDFICSIVHVDGIMAATAGESERRSAWLNAVLANGEAIALSWLRCAQAAGCLPLHRDTEQLEELRRQLQEMPVKTLKELQVNGNDLCRSLGMRKGPWVRELLQRLLSEAASGELPNMEAELLERANIWKIEVNIDEQ
ncbi:CCA tRNA nucleotidyltransferase [Paenibacillus sp. J5C_2022]|uniref:CCA tRNA nucleotidyltransferase n=1 Tax=Paenibacillus sp. J5C2022 TaxID=2977129 RepID=UPI0021D3D376|nr:CCA tRNA nucleotidyltransferase [Paenibacillus sp. J5C2022]MCU6708324.1 CCA tRNA nucleotidyltransferase [Paenibacillus sp. J5C2022]